MPGLVVVNGALLTCDRLASCTQSPLTVSVGFLGPQAGGQPVATINDHVVGKNIKPFPETCLTTGKRCDPAIPASWTPGESAALIVSSAPIIAQSATLNCTTGCGSITIVAPGQSMFEVYPPANTEEKDDKGNFFDSILPAIGAVAATAGGLAGEAAVPALSAAGAGLAGPITVATGAALGVFLVFPDSTSSDDIVRPAIALPRNGPYAYVPPKKGRGKPVTAPGGQPGYIDNKKRIWTRDGDHWDVKNKGRNGNHTNVKEDGSGVHHGDDNFNAQDNAGGNREGEQRG